MLRLTAITVRYVNLRDEEYTAHSLNYVTLLCPFDLSHLITSCEYSLKETVFEICLRLRSADPLFENWHCVDMFWHSAGPAPRRVS